MESGSNEHKISDQSHPPSTVGTLLVRALSLPPSRNDTWLGMGLRDVFKDLSACQWLCIVPHNASAHHAFHGL